MRSIIILGLVALLSTGLLFLANGCGGKAVAATATKGTCAIKTLEQVCNMISEESFCNGELPTANGTPAAPFTIPAAVLHGVGGMCQWDSISKRCSAGLGKTCESYSGGVPALILVPGLSTSVVCGSSWVPGTNVVDFGGTGQTLNINTTKAQACQLMKDNEAGCNALTHEAYTGTKAIPEVKDATGKIVTPAVPAGLGSKKEFSYCAWTPG